MTFSDIEPHIITLLSLSAASGAGITAYSSGKRSEPAYLSYSALLALATQKAGLLQRHKSIVPGKIILLHLQDHLESIIWFWASIIAGCLPALSTALVNSSEGRVSHFRHLYHLLLNPIVVTSQELVSRDFPENDVLQVVAVETLEDPKSCELIDAAQHRTHNSTKILPNSLPDDYVDEPTAKSLDDTTSKIAEPPNGTTKGLSSDVKNGAINGHTEIAVKGVSNGLSHGHGNNHKNLKTCSTEGVAVLMLTSGSTGNAKAVCLNHKQLFAAITGKLSSMPIPQGSALLNWVALDHVASLVEIHLCAMYAGLNQVHVPAIEVVGKPLLFLRLVSMHRVARTFAPNFFLDKLQRVLDTVTAQEIEDVDLCHLLYIASGGELNNVHVCARMTEHLTALGVTNANIITPGFGMTETCAGAIFNRDCPNLDIEARHEFATLGKCVPGINMRISSTADTHIQLGIRNGSAVAEGPLEIHGPIVFEKYFNDDAATRNAFTNDGWFKTGDLANIDSDGNLNLAGRSKELIIINGVKYLPHELEVAIEQARIKGVNQSFVVCFAHRPTSSNTEQIFVLYQHTYEANDSTARVETLHSIVRVVMLFAGARPHVLPLTPGRLEKTALGKLSRAKIQASLAQGEYGDEESFDTEMLQSYRDSHFSEPQNDAERALLAVVAESLGLDNLEMGIDTFILDTGISSVDLIRLKSACEKAFEVDDIPMITVLTNTTIRSLASAIKRLQVSKYEDKYNPVITIQCNGSQTPLWFIHPGIGEILVFLGLAQHFPDRPIHALRARGFNPGEEAFMDLIDVVATYYHALKKQQPHGPYAIAGYSYGSMLAFEITKILSANGDTVQFLGVFNLPPHIKVRMRLLDWTAGLLHIAHFCGIITEQRSEELIDDLRKLPEPEQVRKLLAESDQQRCADLALTHQSLSTWVRVAWSLQKIGWEYDPSGSVANMDVFYCQPLKIVARTRKEYRETKLNHWADFVRGGVRFHEVDGEHYTMIGPEHVVKFQQTLKDALAARGL